MMVEERSSLVVIDIQLEQVQQAADKLELLDKLALQADNLEPIADSYYKKH